MFVFWAKVGRCVNGQRITTYSRKTLCRGMRNSIVSSCGTIDQSDHSFSFNTHILLQIIINNNKDFLSFLPPLKVNLSQHFCCISFTFHIADDFDVPRMALNIVGLIVVIIACLIIALIVAVVIFWKKKKHFEYKYHQLINEQEQPTELSQ
jgi:hypothetical protein